jgi:CBS domain-containing protein
MEPRARDLMESDVVTVDPDTPLVDVHRLFVEEEINGVPVVDDAGAIQGVLSSLDLLRAVEEQYRGDPGKLVPFYFRDEVPYAGPDWIGVPEDFEDRVGALTAADAMVTEVVSVPADMPIADVAHTMRDQHIHRVLVVEDGALVGILSTFDLISLLDPASRRTDLHP